MFNPKPPQRKLKLTPEKGAPRKRKIPYQQPSILRNFRPAKRNKSPATLVDIH